MGVTFNREYWLDPLNYRMDEAGIDAVREMNNTIDVSWWNVWTQNMDENWKRAEHEPWVDTQLYGRVPPGMTAIVCGAGPSLKRHIKQLRMAQALNHSIIAVDAAYKTLKENGIKPILVVTVDGQPEVADMIGNIDKDSYCALNIATHPKTAYVARKARRIWWGVLNPFSAFWDITRRRFGDRIACCRSGYIVTFTAVEIATWMGFDNIITVGNDLCYDNFEDAQANTPGAAMAEYACGLGAISDDPYAEYDVEKTLAAVAWDVLPEQGDYPNCKGISCLLEGAVCPHAKITRYTINSFKKAAVTFSLFPGKHGDKVRYIDVSGGLTKFGWEKGKLDLQIKLEKPKLVMPRSASPLILPGGVNNEMVRNHYLGATNLARNIGRPLRARTA
jgi:hypothetical protein